MPTIDRHGRWHDERGRYMRVAGAISAVEKATGSRRTRRDEAVERTFSTAAAKVAARGASPKASAAVMPAARDGRKSTHWAQGDDVTPEQRARELDGMQTREEAREYLFHIRGKELDALARQYNVQYHRTAADRRAAIVESAVGGRLDHEAFQGAMGPSPLSPEEVARRHAVSGQHPPTPDGVRAAYDELKAEPNAYVSLTRLRARLGGTRAEQDEAIRQVARMGGGNLVPENNQKSLTEADRAASIRFGGQDKHLLAVEDRPSRHTATADGVRAAYAEILRDQNATASDISWVSIADLRDRLGGTRDEQDAALREIEQHGDVNIVPQANERALSERSRLAAVRIGHQDKTHLVIDPSHMRGPVDVDARRRNAAASRADDDARTAASKAKSIADREARYSTPAMQRQIAADAAEIRAEHPGWSDAQVREELEKDYPPGAVAKAMGGPKAKRSGSMQSLAQGLLDRPDRSAPLTGKETKAELHALAAAEGIDLPKSGSRSQLARALESFRFNRDHGGARFFEGGDEPGSSRGAGSLSSVASRVATSSRPRGGSRTAVVDDANGDLVGLSARQLRDLAAREDIALSRGSRTVQQLVNEISSTRSSRRRRFHGLFGS